jgi:hypothetical protein
MGEWLRGFPGTAPRTRFRPGVLSSGILSSAVLIGGDTLSQRCIATFSQFILLPGASLPSFTVLFNFVFCLVRSGWGSSCVPSVCGLKPFDVCSGRTGDPERLACDPVPCLPRY